MFVYFAFLPFSHTLYIYRQTDTEKEREREREREREMNSEREIWGPNEQTKSS